MTIYANQVKLRNKAYGANIKVNLVFLRKQMTVEEAIALVEQLLKRGRLTKI